MSDTKDQPFASFDTFQTTLSALRMVGTANATGALAVGSAYHSFVDMPAFHGSLKWIALTFLYGIINFTLSYLSITFASMELDNFHMSLRERTKWEKIFWILKQSPSRYARKAKRWFGVGLFFGGLSSALFFTGLFAVIFQVGRF
jgi:hypothetical protein